MRWYVPGKLVGLLDEEGPAAGVLGEVVEHARVAGPPPAPPPSPIVKIIVLFVLASSSTRLKPNWLEVSSPSESSTIALRPSMLSDLAVGGVQRVVHRGGHRWARCW